MGKSKGAKKMNYQTSSTLKRLGRGTVALMIAGGTAYIQQHPAYFFLAPVLNAAAKFARVKWGIKWLIF